MFNSYVLRSDGWNCVPSTPKDVSKAQPSVTQNVTLLENSLTEASTQVKMRS